MLANDVNGRTPRLCRLTYPAPFEKQYITYAALYLAS